jgi:hypothetical protein
MGIAEPEGVKLPCNDDMETERSLDDSEEARLVTPGNSPPASPVTIKLQVNVSKMAKSPNLEDTPAKTKQDPPGDSEGKSKVTNVQVESEEVAPNSQSPMSAPPSPRPSADAAVPNVIPSSPVEGKGRARQWSPNEQGIDTKRELPEGWTPGPNSVICGRGKECFEAEGVSEASLAAW